MGLTNIDSMIELLQIPGIWQRPNAPAGTNRQLPSDGSPKNVVLYRGGEADWQFEANGIWSPSGHWKIVKGFHLSIVAIYPSPLAEARGEAVCEFYYHLVSVDADQMVLRFPTLGRFEQIVWTRIAPGQEYSSNRTESRQALG